MTVKKNEIVELFISDLAFGGMGVAKIDDFTIFVDHSVPMDKVSARIIKKKPNYAEAVMLKIIEPSPYRISPECKYSGYCGGCRLQHLNYDKQIEFKNKQVRDCLSHIGLIKEALVLPTLPSDEIFGYRNKMEFSFCDRKYFLPDETSNNESFALGLHVPKIFHKVLDIDKCLLLPETGNHILTDIKKLMKESNLPVYGIRSHTGFWRFLVLRYSFAHDIWMINIVTSSEDKKALEPISKYLVQKYPKISSIVNNINSKKASIAFGEYEISLYGNSVINEKIGDYTFEISSNSFFQTNTNQAYKLYKIVEEYSALKGDETVVDLYCGTGTIALWLAKKAKKVIGIELIESSVIDAKKNANKNNISNCQFICGDIKDTLSDINEKIDVMVIDPPRVGMHKDVIKNIIKFSPSKIIYVSCNPSTLARDVNMLKDHYTLLEVQPVDMFPHTYHIESVAKLVKNNGGNI
ncbi:MAG: 23S rRNA (uracil(1939)-C(5))-methyltransferase RlmD [Desulfobacterales bacterium]|nr:23S rRNA (uracil(1939)-C(5))-methyltransferase RlmD [Desulfobacterales bacterium]